MHWRLTVASGGWLEGDLPGLLGEETAAGSDDPEAQAAEILQESDERVDDPEGTRETYQQTPDQQNPNEPV